MKIETCGEDRLKITLARDDLHDMAISFEELNYAKMETRRVIWELLDQANRQMGFDISQGRLIIEALPMIDGGCVLYFTLLPREGAVPKRAARMHLRRLSGPYIYEFDGADAMMRAALRLHRECRELIPQSALYAWGTGYRLILYMRSTGRQSPGAVLLEYGKVAGEGEAAAAYTAEHGRPLAQENALARIAGGNPQTKPPAEPVA